MSRYYPTPDSAVIGAQVSMYLFNSVRNNGGQGCVDRPGPLVVPDTPIGWTATSTADCAGDAAPAASA